MHPARLLVVAPDAPAAPPPVAVADCTVPGRTDALTPPSAGTPTAAAPARPIPRLPRRQRPWLLVAVDADPSSSTALVWALREAARREATVVAVSVRADAAGDDLLVERPGHGALLAELDARVRAASAEAGVQPQVRTAVLDAQVFEAFAGAARGADLVVVGTHGKTLLRPAVARTPLRRVARIA
ncbi:universal stress protein [Modestobacter lapidis]|nr:universal stress protein [Modestobacter lapidis]